MQLCPWSNVLCNSRSTQTYLYRGERRRTLANGVIQFMNNVRQLMSVTILNIVLIYNAKKTTKQFNSMRFVFQIPIHSI